MKNLAITIALVVWLLPVWSADLIEVSPVTPKILMLKFDDGYIEKHGYHEKSDQDKSFLWKLDTERADNILIYSLSSSDDPDYQTARNPLKLGRKSKGHDFSKKCINWLEEPWPGAACKNDYASYHFIYLELPAVLKEGMSYTLKFSNLADNMEDYTFTFNPKQIRASSIHTNNFGYVPAAKKKYAYLSQWMGTMGPLTDDGLIGKRFDIYALGSDGSIGASVFNGEVAKQKNFNTADNNRTNETPFSNYVVSNVYECDFSSFAAEGEYLLVVEGLGSSYPFRIRADAYHEAFYWTMKGVYLQRALIDAPEQYAGKWAHPAWEDAKFVYTSVRCMDLTDESGNNQKKNIFDNFDWTVDLSAIRGWYHDAGDWDGYFSHFRVPRSLFWTYELAPDNFRDGELSIPEAQVEFNGYTGTHIPDILDEAVWLVDYFKNNVGPTGGIFGSRIHPDISSENSSLGITKANFPGFTFSDCKINGIPSWEDCTTWIVHGEDPRDSYAFASIAAQYVHNLKLAESRTLEDYSLIRDEYLDAAVNAYTWAGNNTLAGDESKKDFRQNRAAAAAWLYKVSGELSYLTQLKADLTALNINSFTTDPGEAKWAVWAYATIIGTDPLYSGTFDQVLQDNLYQVVKRSANHQVTNAIDANRSMRWGGNMMQPAFNGQGTTPWVLEAMIAHYACNMKSDPDAQKYLDACYTTSDYFLGGNQLNMVWLTYIGHESSQQIMHLDSEYHPDHPGFIPGVPAYGPRARCDWFAPGNPHPFAGNNCYYNNSHDADFALLDGRIYPAYNDESGNLTWPVHELYFENYGSPPTNEYTIHQTIAPAAGVYGFLTAAEGNAQPNQEPEISLSTSSSNYNQGEDITISISASDADGWIYRTHIYANNRLIASVMGSPSDFTWKPKSAGIYQVYAKAEDNLGLYKTSGVIDLTVTTATNLPSVNIKSLKNNGLYRVNEELKITAEASPQDVRVDFYVYNEKIGSDDTEPFELLWIPTEEGMTEIMVKAVDDRGLEDSDLKKLQITSNCLEIISPEEGFEFESGVNVSIKAMPNSCSGEIAKVSFFLSPSISLEDLYPPAGNGSYEVIFQNLNKGSYTVYAIAETDGGKIISDTVHFNILDSAIGLDDHYLSGLKVFPNPSSSGFHFQFMLYEASDLEIFIYDTKGQKVEFFSQKSSPTLLTNQFYWEAGNVEPGIYGYTIITEHSTRNGFLVLRK